MICIIHHAKPQSRQGHDYSIFFIGPGITLLSGARRELVHELHEFSRIINNMTEYTQY